jgi:hypothetical protein
VSTQRYSQEGRVPVVVARREGCGHGGEGGCNGVSTWELVLVLRMKSGVLLCLVRPQQEKSDNTIEVFDMEEEKMEYR